MNKYFIFLFYMLLPLISLAQNKYAIKGYVLDNENNAIEGVHVFLNQEKYIGCISQANGYFEIDQLSNGSYEVYFSFIGYAMQSKFIEIDNADVFLNINLQKSDIQLNEITITENKFHDHNELSSNLTEKVIVNSNYLQQNLQQNLLNTLEGIGGIRSANIGTGISKPIIRGLGNNRVVVAQNNIKQEGQQWGSDHGLEIDQFSVNSVELIKGPEALMYGSDAIGGVINTNTINRVNEGHSAEVLLNTRTVNQLFGGSILYAFKRKKWQISSRYTQLEYADFKLPADSFTYNTYTLALPDKSINNTAGKEKDFNFQLSFQGNKYQSTWLYSYYSLKAGFFSGATGIPRSYDVLPEKNKRDIALPQQQVAHHRIEWQQKYLFKKNWIDLTYAFQYNNRFELSLPHSHGFGNIITDSVATHLSLQTQVINLKFHQIINTSTKVVYGASHQWQNNTIDGFEFIIPAYQKNEQGIYAILDKDLQKNRNVSFGLRADRIEQKIEGHEVIYLNDDGSTQLIDVRSMDNNLIFNSLSASLGYKKQINKNNSLKINFGTGFKSPSIADLASNGIHHGTFRHELGNPELQAERSWQAEMAYFTQQKSWEFGVNPFVNYIHNYIYLSPTAKFSQLPEGGQLYEYKQVDALLSGLEARFHKDIHANWHADIGFDFVYAQNLNQQIALPFIPPAQVNFNLSKDFKIQHQEFKIGANYRYNFAQNRVDRNESETPSSSLFNLLISGSFKLKKQAIRTTFQVQNIFNCPYYNHISQYRLINLPEPGRNISLSIILPISFTKSK